MQIVAMTAHAMQGDRERCLAAGMDGYIAKPLDPKTFLQIVEGICRAGGCDSAEAELMRLHGLEPRKARSTRQRCST